MCLCVSICPLLLPLPANDSEPTRHLDSNEDHNLIFVCVCVCVCVCVRACVHVSLYTHITTSAFHLHHHHITPSELNSAVSYHQVIQLSLLQYSHTRTRTHTHTPSCSLGCHSGKENIDDRSAVVKENTAVMTFIIYIISFFLTST